MPNNRMYLVNTRTGRKVYLAKYYPSTGWYLPYEDINDLADKFDEAEFDEPRSATDVLNGNVISGGGMYGAEWKLEFSDGT